MSIDIVNEHDVGEMTTVPTATVEAGLANFFQPETREIKCEKCEAGTHVTQHLRILDRPKVLLLHLKRFIVKEQQVEVEQENTENGSTPFTYTEYVTKKNRAKVKVPKRLSLSAFQAPDTALEDLSKYSLQSIVHHIGSRASSGHYLADAIRPTKDEETGEDKMEWFSFDDTFSGKANIDRIVSNPSKLATAYMLLYSL